MNRLEKDFDKSFVAMTDRGMRRYYPLSYKRKSGKWLHEVFEIIYGRLPVDNFEMSCSLLFKGIDRYVERIDGRLWVRTTYMDSGRIVCTNSLQHALGKDDTPQDSN